MAALRPSCKQDDKPHLPSLNETYRSDDKNPFGSYVAYNRFRQLFQYRYIETNSKPFDEAWEDMKNYSVKTKYSLYVIITMNLIATSNQADALLSFVQEGNDMFISADYIDDYFLNKIHCSEERELQLTAEVAGKMKETSVSIQQDDNYKNASYKYYYYPFLNSFYDFDSAYTKVLGVNEMGKPDYVVFFLGKGRLYLHAGPQTFSNYFLLTKNNYQYLENALSYLRPEPKDIFWDEYYKNKKIRSRTRGVGGKGNDDSRDNEDSKDFSSLSVITKNSPLLWAFWLCVALIITYVVFNIKRRQRIIAEKKPNINTTLVFTETIGRLYLQKKNNKRISEKMITYFYEFVRSRFFLNTSQVSPEFITSLSGKSGIDIAATEKLFATINEVQSKEQISDVELLALNAQVENFYIKRN